MLEQKDFEKFIELALKRLIEMTKVHKMIMINGYNGSGNTVLLKNLSKNLENNNKNTIYITAEKLIIDFKNHNLMFFRKKIWKVGLLAY